MKNKKEGIESLLSDIEKLSKMKRSDEIIIYGCTHCKKPFDYNALLNEYGPEGLYEIANKLIEVADEDVSGALAQCNEELRQKNK